MVNKSIILRKYIVYFEAEGALYKEYVPARSKVDAKRYMDQFNVVGVKEVTLESQISGEKVATALECGGFSQKEIDYIVRTLRRTGIAEI